MKLAALRVVFPGIAALAFSACASVTVKNVDKSHGRRPDSRPGTYYVVPFSTAGASVGENQNRRNPGQLGAEGQRLLAQAMVADISRNLGPARLINSPAQAGRDGWLVTGDFTRINEGNRYLRMFIGLGAGGTKMETRVRVINLPASNPPFLTFSTTGGSGAAFGAVTNPGYSSPATALMNARMGVTDDAERTARMITAAIADYQVQRGWLAAGKVRRPKTGNPLQQTR